MPGSVLLRTERLTRAFGSLIAVDRVDVAVHRGELRSIIGPNGAGKTTLFRLIYIRDPWGSFAEYFHDLDYIPEQCAWEPRDFPEADALYRWGPPVPDDFGLNHEVEG